MSQAAIVQPAQDRWHLFRLVAVVASVRAGLRIAVAASGTGLVALTAAWVTGSAFTQKGGSGFSMAMGALTAAAILCYMVLVKVPGAAGGNDAAHGPVTRGLPPVIPLVVTTATGDGTAVLAGMQRLV